MDEQPFINARTDQPDKGLVRKVMREIAVFQGAVKGLCVWLDSEIKKLSDQIDFCSINAVDTMDRDLIAETLS